MGTNDCSNYNGGCDELCLYNGKKDITFCKCAHGQLHQDTECIGKTITLHYYVYEVLYTLVCIPIICLLVIYNTIHTSLYAYYMYFIMFSCDI